MGSLGPWGSLGLVGSLVSVHFHANPVPPPLGSVPEAALCMDISSTDSQLPGKHPRWPWRQLRVLFLPQTLPRGHGSALDGLFPWLMAVISSLGLLGCVLLPSYPNAYIFVPQSLLCPCKPFAQSTSGSSSPEEMILPPGVHWHTWSTFQNQRYLI